MPRNGSGTFSLPQAPFVTNTTISSTATNSNNSDIAAALTQSISKDGQTTYTGNQPMGGNKLTGLGVGTAVADSVAMSQLYGVPTYGGVGGGTANAITITPSPGITAYAIGQKFSFKASGANTGAVTLNVNSVGAGAITWPDGTTLVAGSIPSGGMIEVEVQATTPVFHLQTVANGGATVLRSYLAGLTLSTAGSSATFGIAVGQATNSTNVSSMALASAYTKTTSAWALGTAAGSLDTGTIANSTWYHVFLIQRVDTSVVDVLTSLSPTAPTLPTSYTLFRRIGAMKTNGSAQWTSFIQDGDLFQWLAPVADISAANPGTSAVTRTLTVPTGVNVLANVQFGVLSVSGGGAAYGALSDLATTDTTPSASFSDVPETQSAAGYSKNSYVPKTVRTNTSAQIRSRINFDDGDLTVKINTVGWTDPRGRDA